MINKYCLLYNIYYVNEEMYNSYLLIIGLILKEVCIFSQNLREVYDILRITTKTPKYKRSLNLYELKFENTIHSCS